MLRLLEDPAHAALVGRRGRAVVQARFLFTRLLEQYLVWFHELASGGAPSSRFAGSPALRTVPGGELPALLASAGARANDAAGAMPAVRGTGGR